MRGGLGLSLLNVYFGNRALNRSVGPQSTARSRDTQLSSTSPGTPPSGCCSSVRSCTAGSRACSNVGVCLQRVACQHGNSSRAGPPGGHTEAQRTTRGPEDRQAWSPSLLAAPASALAPTSVKGVPSVSSSNLCSCLRHALTCAAEASAQCCVVCRMYAVGQCCVLQPESITAMLTRSRGMGCRSIRQCGLRAQPHARGRLSRQPHLTVKLTLAHGVGYFRCRGVCFAACLPAHSMHSTAQTRGC
jgi:hypothetical protein